MNGFSHQCRRAIHVIGVTAVTFLFCVSTQAGEPIEVMLHEDDVYGARDIEAGDYAKGVSHLLSWLANGRRSHAIRTPLVIDLCAGYTMLEDFDAATRYCDEAVAGGWSRGLALNNRGALHVAKGDYDSAIRDFQAAIDERGADGIARRNLQRIEAKVAAMRRPGGSTLARVAPDSR